MRFDGARPFDIRVTDDAFYGRVLRDGALGLGESYVDGWWSAERVDEMTNRLVRADVGRVRNVGLALSIVRARLLGSGRTSSAFEVGERHYDLGNALFEAMLDERMIYTCAYWKDATTLDRAQEQKLELVCRKLALVPGMRVLDIGCGWGGFARFAAERYGVSVVGLTVSREQAALARDACAGFPIEIRLQDYRAVDERFDRIASIGMYEHVGHRYHRTFANVVARCLEDDGLFLLHTIVGDEPLGATEIPWIVKYIFPNAEIPSLRQIVAAAEGRLVVEGMHRFGDDYERTLEAWHERFIAAWPSLAASYDDRFFRMWTYYLQMARGTLASRRAHVWQVVFSKRARSGTLGRRERASAVESWEAR